MKKVRIFQSDLCNIETLLEEQEVIKVAYSHRNYILGNEKIGDLESFLLDKLGQTYTRSSIDNLISRFKRKYYVLDLYLYDHSGLALNTTGFHCRWDSGQIGFVYIDKETAKKESWNKKRALQYMENVVKEMDNIVRGNQYGFRIEDENDDIIGACGGFIGEPKEVAEWMLEHMPEDITIEQVNEAFDNIEY